MQGISNSYIIGDESAGADTIYAENNLGKEPVANEKVLINQLNQMAGVIKKSDTNIQYKTSADTTTISNYATASYCPILSPTGSNTVIIRVYTTSDPNTILTYNEEDDIYISEGSFTAAVSGAYPDFFRVLNSYVIATIRNVSIDLADNIVYQDGVYSSKGVETTRLLNYNYDYTNYVVWERDEFLNNTTQVGTITNNTSGRYDPVHIFSNGDMLVRYYNNKTVRLCKFNSSEKTWNMSTNTTLSFASSAAATSYQFVFGATNDEKYLIFYDNGKVDIYEVSEDHTTYTALQKVSTNYQKTAYWNQNEQILIMLNSAQTTIKMYKYENGEWSDKDFEVSTDIGYTSYFRVIVSNDMSKAVIVNGDKSSCVLCNLISKEGGYRAVPAVITNFNSTSLTGFTTGNVDSEGKVEVNTLLPLQSSDDSGGGG